MDDLESLARLVEALRPWQRQLVIVGGWAHRLHRFHEGATAPAHEPLHTDDVDVAMPTAERLEGDIGAALKSAGFHEVLSGDHVPPVSEYRLGDEEEGFYAEFLAPLRGSGHKRDGTEDATVARAGVTAQKLRHLDVLLIHPWTIHLGADVGVPLASPADVRLPNPVSFIAQKLLIHASRPPGKRAQDALYVHDTLELFGGALEMLREIWREQVRPGLHARTAREVERCREEQYGTVTDALRTAARLQEGRGLTPARVQAACAYGLQAVFGD